ncbi:MAG TPA: FIST N-terminal domain-containing protein [Solirubrobacteraceae bacterium]|jgi:small ligand-binding sensory domain FIST
MAIHIGSGLATGGEARGSGVEAALQAREGLAGERADLVVVFVAGGHVRQAAAVLEGIHEALAPRALIGCGAGGVLGGRREVESGTAVAVWAAALGDGSAETFHAEAEQMSEGVGIVGFPDLTGAAGAILLPDPYSFPTDPVLQDLARRTPGVPIVGGVASARASDDGGALLLHGEEVVAGGAVGVRLDGVEMLPCVSQGAAPVGPELTITAAEGQIISELAGQPALEKLREVILDLPSEQRELVARGPLLGLVIDGGKPEYLQGDFLVRGLVGADPDEGTIAVGALVEPGQVVRLHARDADSADRDLREALHLRREALGGAEPAGALVFTCNGRGRAMFGSSDHDAEVIGDELGDVPQAGFFAAGEIGPVGGGSFLHGFTATVGVFPA